MERNEEFKGKRALLYSTDGGYRAHEENKEQKEKLRYPTEVQNQL